MPLYGGGGGGGGDHPDSDHNIAVLSTTAPLRAGTATQGAGVEAARETHVHPLDPPANLVWVPGPDGLVGDTYATQGFPSGHQSTVDARLYVMPFRFNRSTPLKVGWYIPATAGSAGAVFRFGVWDRNGAEGNRPAAHIANLGSVAADAVGYRFAPTAFTPEVGRWYAIGGALLGAPAVAPMAGLDGSNRGISVPSAGGATGPTWDYTGVTASTFDGALGAPNFIGGTNWAFYFQLA